MDTDDEDGLLMLLALIAVGADDLDIFSQNTWPIQWLVSQKIPQIANWFLQQRPTLGSKSSF
jgi:hypothetical protein